MAKPVRLTPVKTALGTWRLNVPAKLSETGARQRLFYSTRAEALDAAALLKERRATFGDSAVAISPSIAERAVAAEALLEPFGVDLLEACRAYAKARGALDPLGITHDEAVADFVRAETQKRASVTIEAALNAFRNAKSDLSTVQKTAYRLRAEKLITAFGGRLLADIKGEELRKHLEATTGGGPTYNQALRHVGAIWRWCAKPPRGWCDAQAVAHLELKKTVAGAVGVLTAKQVRRLFEVAEEHLPDCVPALAIAVFAGLRQAELERLEVADVTADGIAVRAEAAKTGRRRFIQMPEPLRAWLAAYPLSDGIRVCPPNWPRKYDALRYLAGWAVWAGHVEAMNFDPPMPATPPAGAPAWPQNALRHTAASVGVALGKAVETLIFEHGHSGGPALLARHYLGTMPRKEALAIWKIGPRGTTLETLKTA